MKEIVEEILAEEKKARERVSEARERAKQIRLEAEAEAQKILEESRQKSQDEAAEMIAKSKNLAEEERTKTLKKAASGENFRETKKHQIQRVTESITQRVLGKGDALP